MKIIYLLLIVCFSIVTAKYLPDEKSPSSGLHKPLDESESNESIQTVEDNNSDEENSDDGGSSLERKLQEQQRKYEERLAKLRQKELEREEKLRLKLEKESLKLQEKQRKEEEKQADTLRKEQEKIEKEKLKQEQQNRKRQEKLEREELKHLEKQRKEQEKIRNKVNEPVSVESEEEKNSVELEDIWKSFIYEKYGLAPNSSKLEKKSAVYRYLQEELGLNVNSTKSEFRQAVLNLVQTKLQNDTASQVALRNHILGHVNAVGIQQLKAELEGKLVKLNNEISILNSLNATSSLEVQYRTEQKTFIQEIIQFFKNLLPNWVTGAPIPVVPAGAYGNSSSSLVSSVTGQGISAESSGVSGSDNVAPNVIVSGHVDNSVDPSLTHNPNNGAISNNIGSQDSQANIADRSISNLGPSSVGESIPAPSNAAPPTEVSGAEIGENIPDNTGYKPSNAVISPVSNSETQVVVDSSSNGVNFVGQNKSATTSNVADVSIDTVTNDAANGHLNHTGNSISNSESSLNPVANPSAPSSKASSSGGAESSNAISSSSSNPVAAVDNRGIVAGAGSEMSSIPSGINAVPNDADNSQTNLAENSLFNSESSLNPVANPSAPSSNASSNSGAESSNASSSSSSNSIAAVDDRRVLAGAGSETSAIPSGINPVPNDADNSPTNLAENSIFNSESLLNPVVNQSAPSVAEPSNVIPGSASDSLDTVNSSGTLAVADSEIGAIPSAGTPNAQKNAVSGSSDTTANGVESNIAVPNEAVSNPVAEIGANSLDGLLNVQENGMNTDVTNGEASSVSVPNVSSNGKNAQESSASDLASLVSAGIEPSAPSTGVLSIGQNNVADASLNVAITKTDRIPGDATNRQANISENSVSSSSISQGFGNEASAALSNIPPDGQNNSGVVLDALSKAQGSSAIESIVSNSAHSAVNDSQLSATPSDNTASSNAEKRPSAITTRNGGDSDIASPIEATSDHVGVADNSLASPGSIPIIENEAGAVREDVLPKGQENSIDSVSDATGNGVGPNSAISINAPPEAGKNVLPDFEAPGVASNDVPVKSDVPAIDSAYGLPNTLMIDTESNKSPQDVISSSQPNDDANSAHNNENSPTGLGDNVSQMNAVASEIVSSNSPTAASSNSSDSQVNVEHVPVELAIVESASTVNNPSVVGIPDYIPAEVSPSSSDSSVVVNSISVEPVIVSPSLAGNEPTVSKVSGNNEVESIPRNIDSKNIVDNVTAADPKSAVNSPSVSQAPDESPAEVITSSSDSLVIVDNVPPVVADVVNDVPAAVNSVSEILSTEGPVSGSTNGSVSAAEIAVDNSGVNMVTSDISPDAYLDNIAPADAPVVIDAMSPAPDTPTEAVNNVVIVENTEQAQSDVTPNDIAVANKEVASVTPVEPEPIATEITLPEEPGASIVEIMPQL